MGFPPSQARYSRVTSQKHGEFFLGTLIIFFFLPFLPEKHKKAGKKIVRSVKFCFQISKLLNLILLLSFQPPDLDVVFICYRKLYLGEITPFFFFKIPLNVSYKFPEPYKYKQLIPGDRRLSSAAFARPGWADLREDRLLLGGPA